MSGRIPKRAEGFSLKKPARFGRRHKNSGLTEASPRQPLSAAVAESLILPLHRGLATRTYGKRTETVSPAKGANRINPHGRAIGFLLHVVGYLKEAVGSFAEAVAEILQNGDRRDGFPADDSAEISGRATAMPGGGLIGQPRFVAQAGEGIG